MHKALTQMNLQLNLVISDITGGTGMRIIRAIINGERNPHALAELKDYRCKKEVEKILGVDLTEIPGFDANTVIKIIGEIGTDMSR